MADELKQSATVLTNELRLHDWNNAMLSITFGDSDQDGGYAYANFKYKVNESKIDFIMDRDIYNLVGPTQILLNNKKIWHENNDGPNSGLNADLLDGRHAVEFKDRYGYHHFIHMFKKPQAVTDKCFVKIATFTMRKIGTPDDFNSDGTPPYSGVFEYTGNGVGGITSDSVVVPGGTFRKSDIIEGMQIRDAITQFQADTPYALSDYDPDLFHSTNMLTQGTYNGTLRGCVSILKDGKPTTFDFHIGLFDNPTASPQADGWDAIYKYFYVSLHDETLPFLSESDWTLSTNNDPYLNKGVPDTDSSGNPYNVNADTDDKNGDKNSAGAVVDGYSSSYPSFPSYGWNDPNLPGMNNNLAYVDSISAGHAMANLYFDKPDSSKAKALKDIKKKYNNDPAAALKDGIKRIKDLGMAMAELGGDDELKTTDMKVGADTTSDPIIQGAKTAMADSTSEAKDDYDEDMSDALEDADASPDIDTPAPSETHARYQTKVQLPGNMGDYKVPIMTEQDAKPYKSNRRRKAFPDPNDKDQGDSYQQFVDVMRLYNTKNRKDVIDGMTVITYYYDLYMCIDAKSEVRVQPYMSSQCLLLNFQPCVQEADLPQPPAKFIRPKSIYDNRYASVHHRHYDYERRIWELTLEVDQIWKNFYNYVKIEQGYQNAYKVMMTDKSGRVYAAQDNMERHAEPIARRIPDRVIISMSQAIQHIEGEADQLVSCIGTSDITTTELEALKGIGVNIQKKLDDLDNAINSVKEACDHIWEALNALEAAIAEALGNFVEIPGDTMTGGLWMDRNTATTTYAEETPFTGGCQAFGFKGGPHPGGYTYGSTSNAVIGWGYGPGKHDWGIKWFNNKFAINGTTLTFVTGVSGDVENTKEIDLSDLANVLTTRPWESSSSSSS